MSQLNGNLGTTERWISALLGAGFTLAAIGEGDDKPGGATVGAASSVRTFHGGNPPLAHSPVTYDWR
jgi:hypothetical protein